ncbi:MAG TPA: alpha/beta fold hydrolase [Steroidobacteraceae bacterium]|nr:alpha/beta fold hydrolase [Steroidobacteraceae bacterium]
MPNEVPQFFSNARRQRLYSVLHLADEARTQADFAVVFCAPLFDEKLWSHRVLVNYARSLASQGIPVLRFDYFGDGESEGRFEEATVTSRIADILDAVAFCRSRAGVRRVFLLGLGYGAALALSAGKSGAVDGVVAWAPVMSGQQYASDLLRAHLGAQMVLHRKVIHDREALTRQIHDGGSVNIEGYEIANPFFSELLATDTRRLIEEQPTRVALVQIAPVERIDPQYAPIAESAGTRVQFFAVRELKFWMQQKTIFSPCAQLFQRTTQWLNEGRAA